MTQPSGFREARAWEDLSNWSNNEYVVQAPKVQQSKEAKALAAANSSKGKKKVRSEAGDLLAKKDSSEQTELSVVRRTPR